MWNHLYEVPSNRKIRYIVHSDAFNEADDQYTIAHALMMEKFDVVGLIGGHFHESEISRVDINHTADASYEEILKILSLMGITDKKVFAGSNFPLEDTATPQRCRAVDFIIEEAMKDDDRPLYIGLQGAITDLASAILIEPRICERMTAIWIGGGDYPEGSAEFNLRQDINAVNVVFSSTMPVWQIPLKAYRPFATSLAELQLKVRPCGELGKYLFEQLVEFNLQVNKWDLWPHGEMWTLGDEGCIAALLEDMNKDDNYEMIEAPFVLPDGRYEFGHGNREIRVYNTLDARLDLEDLFAKLKINFADKPIRKTHTVNKKVYSGIQSLPKGNSSDILTDGCICLEGGAFRGVYTSGVLDALMENDINFKCVIGVSAGALNGYNYVSGQIGRSGWINLAHRHDSKYVGGRAFLHSKSPLNLDYLFNEVAKDWPFDQERFDNPERRYIAVATHYGTGRSMYFEKGVCEDIESAVKASASLPYMTAPVMVDGVPCLDGGANGCKIPYEWALDNDFSKIVIVKTREHGYRREIGDSEFPLRYYHKTPKFAKALQESDEVANRQLEEIERLSKEKRVFVIEPSEPVNVSRLESDMEKLGDLYYLGYNDTLEKIAGLREYLNS